MLNEKKMSKFIDKYSHIFGIGQGCMDPDLSLINDADYYGIDFSKQNVYQLFFTGSNNFFYGIVKLGDRLDNCPIYLFDLAIASDSKPKFLGNFRTFIGHLLDEISSFINNDAINDNDSILTFDNNIYDENLLEMSIEDMNRDIRKAKKDLKQFSDETMIFFPSYAWYTIDGNPLWANGDPLL